MRTRDYARAVRAYQRQLRKHQAKVDMAATAEDGGGDEWLPTRGTIYTWSRRSRARLVARLSDLDYTRLYGRYRVCVECGRDYGDPLDRCSVCRSTLSELVDPSGRLPAMLTLTYPVDWLAPRPARPNRATFRGLPRDRNEVAY